MTADLGCLRGPDQNRFFIERSYDYVVREIGKSVNPLLAHVFSNRKRA